MVLELRLPILLSSVLPPVLPHAPSGGDVELQATCAATLHHICAIAHILVDGELRPVFTTENGSVCKCVWQKNKGIVRIRGTTVCVLDEAERIGPPPPAYASDYTT